MAEIKVTLKELINSQQPLQRVMGMEFPASTSFQIAKVIRLLEAELTAYEQARLKLINKLDGLADPPVTDEEKETRSKVDAEYETLIETEVTLSYEPFKISQLSSANISPRDLVFLSWLFTE